MNNLLLLFLLAPLGILTGYLWYKLLTGHGYYRWRIHWFLIVVCANLFLGRKSKVFTEGKDATFLSKLALFSVVVVLTVIFGILSFAMGWPCRTVGTFAHGVKINSDGTTTDASGSLFECKVGNAVFYSKEYMR